APRSCCDGALQGDAVLEHRDHRDVPTVSRERRALLLDELEVAEQPGDRERVTYRPGPETDVERHARLGRLLLSDEKNRDPRGIQECHVAEIDDNNALERDGLLD